MKRTIVICAAMLATSSLIADNRYWIGNIVNTQASWLNTANWSTTDGGSGGSAVPTSNDDVYMLVRSGSAATNASINLAEASAGSTYNMKTLTIADHTTLAMGWSSATLSAINIGQNGTTNDQVVLTIGKATQKWAA